MHLLDFQGHTFIQISHILLFRFSRLSGSQWSSALPVVCVLLILVVLISIAAVWTQFSAEHFFSAGELDSSCTGSNITDQVHFLSVPTANMGRPRQTCSDLNNSGLASR